MSHPRLLAEGRPSGGLTHFRMQGKELEIFVFEDIDSLFGFSSKDLMDQLRRVPKDTPITVYVNSYGGEVFEGLSIYNILRSWKGSVKTICTGIAASVASVIFLAGREREIYDNAQIMIHNPFFASASGDADDLQRLSDLARKTADDFVGTYAAVSGQDKDTILEWMKGETFFSAEEAVENKFATKIVEAPQVLLEALSPHKLVAKLQQRSNQMKFDEWLKAECKTLGLDYESLTDEQKTKFKARYDKLVARKAEQDATQNAGQDDSLAPNHGTHTRDPVSSSQRNDGPTARGDADGIQGYRDRLAAENERVDMINSYVAEHQDDHLDNDYVQGFGTKSTTLRGFANHAIKKGWTVDKFELEARRASIPDIGGAVVHSRSSVPENEGQALTAALCREAGVSDRAKSPDGRDIGLESMYNEQTLDASDRYRGFSLLQTLDLFHQRVKGYRYQGRQNTDGFMSAMRDVLHKVRAEGNTSWTSLNIFDDVANKILWNAYETQRTTWRQWAATQSVNDFKTHNMYRLSMTGGYRKVGADGELQHGGFTDSKYTVNAETYGKIVGLSRRDVINDDLGALSGIMRGLGVEGAKFLEELAYLTLMNNLTTVFPIADTYNNYISGSGTALGIDGLSEAEQKFADQVDDDDAPLMVDAEVLLVGTNNAVLAKELYNQTKVTVTQDSGGRTKERPDGNPHVGKFDPVVSPYLNNTNLKQRTDVIGVSSIGDAIPNQSDYHWMILPRGRNAYGAIIMLAFLNGRQRPFVEQGDPAFDVLGFQYRAYHDAGASTGDPKLGVYSKGKA